MMAAQRDYLVRQRQAGIAPNPLFWAAFVSSGVGVYK